MALIFGFILLVIIICMIIGLCSAFTETPEERARLDQINKDRLAVLLKKKKKYGRLSDVEYDQYKHLINIGTL